MSLVFPSNPALNQTTTTGGRVWTYNGDGWATSTGGSSANLEAITGNVIPSASSIYDIGSSGARWRDLYLSGNTIDLGGTEISTTVTGHTRFADANNSNQLRGITAAEILLSTDGNVVTLQGGASGLVTLLNGNVVSSGSGGGSFNLNGDLDFGTFSTPSGMTLDAGTF